MYEYDDDDNDADDDDGDDVGNLWYKNLLIGAGGGY